MAAVAELGFGLCHAFALAKGARPC
jgi:hypothetical protein